MQPHSPAPLLTVSACEDGGGCMYILSTRDYQRMYDRGLTHSHAGLLQTALDQVAATWSSAIAPHAELRRSVLQRQTQRTVALLITVTVAIVGCSAFAPSAFYTVMEVAAVVAAVAEAALWWAVCRATDAKLARAKAEARAGTAELWVHSPTRGKLENSYGLRMELRFAAGTDTMRSTLCSVFLGSPGFDDPFCATPPEAIVRLASDEEEVEGGPSLDPVEAAAQSSMDERRQRYGQGEARVNLEAVAVAAALAAASGPVTRVQPASHATATTPVIVVPPPLSPTAPSAVLVPVRSSCVCDEEDPAATSAAPSAAATMLHHEACLARGSVIGLFGGLAAGAGIGPAGACAGPIMPALWAASQSPLSCQQQMQYVENPLASSPWARQQYDVEAPAS